MTKAVWFGPNLENGDYSHLVTRAGEWADVWGPDGVQCFHLHPEVLLWGPEQVAAGAAPKDYFTPLKRSGLLPFLKAKGVPLVVELGVIKPGQFESLNGTFSRDVQLPQILQRAAECGGVVSGIAMDEPLTGWRAWAQPAGISYQRAIDATAEFVNHCQSLGLGAMLVEAYPYNVAEDIIAFQQAVRAKAPALDGVTLDVDYLYRLGWRRCGFLGLQRCPVYITREQIAADFREIESVMPLNIIVMAIKATDDIAYRSEAIDWCQFVAGPGRMLLVESWREYPSTTNRLLPTDLPYHVDVVRAALRMADDRPRPGVVIPPAPGPQPVSDRWIGATAFRLPQLQMAGQDIRPLLQQYKDCGFNRIRVFGMKYNNTGWELDPHGRPRYFEEDMPRFLDTCKEFGLVGEWNALVDTRQLMPDHAAQVEFVRRTVEVLKRYPGWTFSLGNEVTNGDWQTIDLAAFSKPDGIYSCHGSSGTDETPVKPFWDYATYGARRMDHAKDGRAFTTYSPYAFEEDYPKPVPFVATEGEKPERYGFDTTFARLIGQHAKTTLGGFFHYPQGINGQLMPPEVEACARAFVEGLTR